MEQKLESLQVGRGVAAFMVLLFHSQVFMRVVHPESGFARMFGFGRTGVDFFFVLSGFLMVYVHRRDFGAPSRLGVYAYKRLTRIYPVYWVLCAVLVPLVLLAPIGDAESGEGDAPHAPDVGVAGAARRRAAHRDHLVAGIRDDVLPGVCGDCECWGVGTGNAEQYRRAAARAIHPRLRAQPARG